MTISKYDVTSLFMEHIIFSVYATMFYLFRVFDDTGQYIVNVKDCIVVIKEVLNSDISVFENAARYYGFERCPADMKPSRKSLKIKPTCAEDLAKCFTIGMTQTEKKEAIMKWWRCGSSTARHYM